MNASTISLTLAIFGVAGTIVILSATGGVLWQYRQARIGSFRWQLRGWRLKQLCAIACLFFLAMAASYGVILQPLGWIYLLVAFKVGTWWFRHSVSQRT
jgi:hypothetical protein